MGRRRGARSRRCQCLGRPLGRAAETLHAKRRWVSALHSVPARCVGTRPPPRSVNTRVETQWDEDLADFMAPAGGPATTTSRVQAEHAGCRPSVQPALLLSLAGWRKPRQPGRRPKPGCTRSRAGSRCTVMEAWATATAGRRRHPRTQAYANALRSQRGEPYWTCQARLASADRRYRGQSRNATSTDAQLAGLSCWRVSSADVAGRLHVASDCMIRPANSSTHAEVYRDGAIGIPFDPRHGPTTICR